MSSSATPPCGACKFLRRKCASDCVFAPHFSSDEGTDRFAAIHKVFGASNVSKLLLHLPVADRAEAVTTVAYEAVARLRDPVYGCVSHIFALQQQVVCLQAQLMQVKAQLSQSHAGTRNVDQNNHLWGGAGTGIAPSPTCPNISHRMMMSAVSPQSSHESMDHDYSSGSDHSGFNSSRSEELSDFLNQSAANYCNISGNKRGFMSNNDLSELQALAFGIMRNS